jgi:hypothetical protein
MKMKVKVTYQAYTDGGPTDRGHSVTVGYFDSLEEAKSEMYGLCSWHFDHYGGSRIENGFSYETLVFDDEKRDRLIANARKSAKDNEKI